MGRAAAILHKLPPLEEEKRTHKSRSWDVPSSPPPTQAILGLNHQRVIRSDRLPPPSPCVCRWPTADEAPVHKPKPQTQSGGCRAVAAVWASGSVTACTRRGGKNENLLCGS